VLKALQAQWVRRVHRERPGLKEPRAQPERKELQALREPLGPKAPLALLELPVLRVLQAQ
jgi:hypothetical protein